MRLERAYYDCAPCEGGFCPRDRALGLEGTSLSPAVTRMVGLSASPEEALERGFTPEVQASALKQIAHDEGMPIDTRQRPRISNNSPLGSRLPSPVRPSMPYTRQVRSRAYRQKMVPPAGQKSFGGDTT